MHHIAGQLSYCHGGHTKHTFRQHDAAQVRGPQDRVKTAMVAPGFWFSGGPDE